MIDPAAVCTELRHLAATLHGGAFGPSVNEWDMYADPRPCTGNTLYNAFGARHWADILAVAGLRHGTRKEYHQHTMARRRARAHALDGPLPAAPVAQQEPDGWGLAAIVRKRVYYHFTLRRWVAGLVYELR